MEDLKKWLLHNAFTADGNRINPHWPKKSPHMLKALEQSTDFFPDSVTIAERVFAFLNGQTELNKCIVCGSAIIPSHRSQQLYCGPSCTGKSPITKNKVGSTCRRRYNTSNPMKSEVVRNKSKNTCRTRYGGDTPASSPLVLAKIRKTNLSRYGVENVLSLTEVRDRAAATCMDRYGHRTGHCQSTADKASDTNVIRYGEKVASRSNIIKQKTKETCRTRYGCDAPMQASDVQARSRQTNFATIGHEYPMQSSTVRAKAITTCLAKYAVANPASSDVAKQSTKDTCMQKYGVEYPGQIPGVVDKARATFRHKLGADNPSQVHYTPEQLSVLTDKTVLESLYIKNGYNATTTGSDLGVSHSTILRYLRRNGSDVKTCIVSAEEKCLFDYFSTEIGVEVHQNRRDLISPYELDLYFPEHSIAVEYDGLYWHTESNKGRSYHLKKTELCRKNGIHLLHIFSSDNMEIWKSVICSKLGIYERRIGARSTAIREVRPDDARTFLSSNHLQGAINSSIRLGLYHENELVSLMTFGKSRFNKSYEYELLRFCSKIGYQVIGGASKLLKHSGIKNCVSYANRRWSDGQLYTSLGFKYVGESSPNYFYTDDCIKLHSRNQFQKHMLEQKLDVFDPELSESANMANNGYSRIWDCGNLVYEYKC